MDKSVTYEDDIGETIAYWRKNNVRAAEVLCSMGKFGAGKGWREVGLAMKRWRAGNAGIDRDLHHLSWNETERELTGWYSTVLW